MQEPRGYLRSEKREARSEKRENRAEKLDLPKITKCPR